MSGRLEFQHTASGRQGSTSLDLEGPRRWLTKHAEELKNMLPLRRLKGLGLHGQDSKFANLSTEDITTLVKEVMTFETSRRNAIQDSTESLKATVMDSAVSDFCHEHHVSSMMKQMHGRTDDSAVDEAKPKQEDSLNDLVSLLHVTETAVTIIQKAFRSWQQRWHQLQPSERARVRARYMQAVRKVKTKRKEAAAAAEAEKQEAARRRRQSRSDDASLWLEQALHKAEEATLQFSLDLPSHENSMSFSKPHSVAQTPRLQSASAQRALGFGRVVVSAKPKRVALSVSGTATPHPAAEHSSSTPGASPQSYSPTPQIDTRDLSELTPMEKVRRVAQTILKASPHLEAQMHGRHAADPGAPTPGALMLQSLLHTGVGGLNLMGVSTAEELAERLKEEVARRVEDLIQATPADREEDMPHLRRIQSLMQQAHAVVKASDDEMATVQAAGDAATEQLTGHTDDEAAEQEPAQAPEQQVAAPAAPAGPEATKKTGKKVAAKGHSKHQVAGKKTPAKKSSRSPSSPASSETDTAPGRKSPAPSRLRARPSAASPVPPPRGSPPGSPHAPVSPRAPGSPRATAGVRVLDLLRAGELDQWMVRVSAQPASHPRGSRRIDHAAPGSWADTPAYVAAHAVETQEEQWRRQQEWEKRQRERAEQTERERQAAEAQRQRQQQEMQARRQRRAEEHRTKMEERMRQLHAHRNRTPTAAEFENGRWFGSSGLHYTPVREQDPQAQVQGESEQGQGSGAEPLDDGFAAAAGEPANPQDVFSSGFPWTGPRHSGSSGEGFYSPRSSGYGQPAIPGTHANGNMPRSHGQEGLQPVSDQEDEEAEGSGDEESERRVKAATLAAVHSSVCLAVLLEVLGESGPAPSGVSQLPPLLEGMGLGHVIGVDRPDAHPNGHRPLAPRLSRPLLTTKSGKEFADSNDTWGGLTGTVRSAWRSDGPTAPQPLVLTVDDEQLPSSFRLQGAQGRASMLPAEPVSAWRGSQVSPQPDFGSSHDHHRHGVLTPTRTSRPPGTRRSEAQHGEGEGTPRSARTSMQWACALPSSAEQVRHQAGPSGLPAIDSPTAAMSPFQAAFLRASSPAVSTTRPGWATPESWHASSSSVVRPQPPPSAVITPSSAALPVLPAASIPPEAAASICDDQLGLVTMFCLETASQRHKPHPSSASPLTRLSHRPSSSAAATPDGAGAASPGAGQAPLINGDEQARKDLGAAKSSATVHGRHRRASAVEGFTTSGEPVVPGVPASAQMSPTPMRQRQRRASMEVNPALHSMSSPSMHVQPPSLLARRFSGAYGQQPHPSSCPSGEVFHSVATVCVPSSAPQVPGRQARLQAAPQAPKLHDWWGAQRRQRQAAPATVPG